MIASGDNQETGLKKVLDQMEAREILPEELTALADSIYSGPTEAEPWTGFAQLLKHSMRCAHVAIIIRWPDVNDQGAIVFSRPACPEQFRPKHRAKPI